MRLQNRVGNKRWETLGHILAPIKNRDSYKVRLDNQKVDRFHRKHIRKEPEVHGELSDRTRGFPNLEGGRERQSGARPEEPLPAPAMHTRAQTRKSRLQNRWNSLEQPALCAGRTIGRTCHTGDILTSELFKYGKQNQEILGGDLHCYHTHRIHLL